MSPLLPLYPNPTNLWNRSKVLGLSFFKIPQNQIIPQNGGAFITGTEI